jgi:hypothetical protein
VTDDAWGEAPIDDERRVRYAMSDPTITEPVEPAGTGGPTEPVDGTSPRSARRWLKPVIWIASILVFLVIVFFVADAILRAYAEGQVAEQIQNELPKDVKADDLKVDITGFSVIAQYLSGSLDEVTLTAKEAEVNGVPVAAAIVGRGIPVDLSKPVERIHGSMTLSQDAANQLIKIPGSTSTITFGTGSLGYSGSVEAFGLPIAFTTKVSPQANGKTILLTPTSVKIDGGPAQVDLSSIVSQLLGNKPYPLCVASYLPSGVTVTDVTVRKGSATIAVSAHDIVLDEKTFDSHDTCS